MPPANSLALPAQSAINAPQAAHVNIAADLAYLTSLNLAPDLLIDRTANRNLIWGASHDARFAPTDQISAQALVKPGLIQPRAARSAACKLSRARKQGEVATPFRVCAQMCAYLKKQMARKSWQKRICARVLEIACGEAPFLATRYDLESGKIIPLPDRCGLLDQKLRLVCESADNRRDWREWAFKALQSTYGYEYQGDNAIIARANILLTLRDWHLHKFGEAPDIGFFAKAAWIVSWNIWQMDGLQGVIPHGRPEKSDRQAGLFGETKKSDACLIKNWQTGKIFRFLDAGETMKFDYIIGNPPYQEESLEAAPESNGQIPRKNIFHFFQMEVDKIASKASALIYPGKRWMHRSGKGMDEFGKKQLNDHHLKTVIYYPDYREVFPGVEIADGLSIVLKDYTKEYCSFKLDYRQVQASTKIKVQHPGDSLIVLNPLDNEISNKVEAFVSANKLNFMANRILSRSLFGIESNFVESNPTKVRPYIDTDKLNAGEIKLLVNDKAGKGGKSKWFVASRDIIKSNSELINEWQVVVSSANAGGQKRDNQIQIIDDNSAFGRSRVALASFKTSLEAQNFLKFATTYIARFMFLMTDEALTSLGKLVPDLGDYSSANSLIDFDGDIDNQLEKLINLTAAETEYIKNRVDNLRKNPAISN